MTVTRQSLRFKCSVKDCPWPDDKDIHVPWCLGIPDVEHWADKPTHQHYPKKGMGGNNPESKIVAILCPPCHDRIDNGTDWGNGVNRFAGGGEQYVAFDLHGNTLIKRDLPSLKEEGDGRANSSSGDVNAAGNRGDSHPSLGLTHEQRVAKALEIKDMEWNRQFIAGDTGNAWIAEINEEAEQYLCDFGYQPESLSNILRVCAAIPPPYRNGNLRYSHHVVVYQLPREDQVLRLQECADEGWSVAEFRRQVHGSSSRAKRWPLSELLEGVEAWPHPTDRPRPKGAVRAYLKWLGEQT